MILKRADIDTYFLIHESLKKCPLQSSDDYRDGFDRFIKIFFENIEIALIFYLKDVKAGVSDIDFSFFLENTIGDFQREFGYKNNIKNRSEYCEGSYQAAQVATELLLLVSQDSIAA